MSYAGRYLARPRTVWVLLALAGILLLYGGSLHSPFQEHSYSPHVGKERSAPRGPAYSADLSEDSGPGDGHHTERRGVPADRHPPRVVLYWSRLFYDRDFRLGFGRAPFEGCSVSNCVATDDRSQFSVASGVMFNARNVMEKYLPEEGRRPDQKYIFVNQEPPFLTWIKLNHLNGFFNLTMTYSSEADIYFPYGETVKGGQEETVPGFHERKAAAAWMVSHCETHSMREKYVSELEQYLPVVKIGKCGTLVCDAPINECYRRMAADYLFYLAFENSLCDDYITEKFWLALRFGLVPVVRGAAPEAYSRVAPPNSFIHVQSFAGPAALATYLRELASNETAYSEYHAWRGTHRVQERRSACDLCAELWKSPGVSRQLRISKLWSSKRLCHWADDVETGLFVDRVIRLKSKLVKRRQAEREAALNRSLRSRAPPPPLQETLQTDGST